MAVEREIKLRVSDPEAVRSALRAAGAVRVAAGHERNMLLDDDAATLRRCDRGLRIRRFRPDETREERATLTFKGPRDAGPVKSRAEFETAVDDPGALVAILAALGFRERVSYEKHRETWRLGPCEVCLDELPGVGRFVEIEGPDARAIDAARAALGLHAAAEEPRTYAELAAVPPRAGARRDPPAGG